MILKVFFMLLLMGFSACTQSASESKDSAEDKGRVVVPVAVPAMETQPKKVAREQEAEFGQEKKVPSKGVKRRSDLK